MEQLSKRGISGMTPLDSGGQGNVYRALYNGKLCAVKVTPIKLKNADDDRKLDVELQRELQISSRLRHPSCMAVWDIFRTKTRVYTVMPLMAGGSIGKKIREEGPRCEHNAKAWFCPIARAIRYLHNNKVVHR